MSRSKECYCHHCGHNVVAIAGQGISGARVVAIGVFALLAPKTGKLACPKCGRPLRGAKKNYTFGKTYRCEKNDHNLDGKRDICPIDGSKVRRVG